MYPLTLTSVTLPPLPSSLPPSLPPPFSLPLSLPLSLSLPPFIHHTPHFIITFRQSLAIALSISNACITLQYLYILSYEFYFAVVAFAIAAHQNKQLLGKDGLLPTDLYLKKVSHHFGGPNWKTFLHTPSLLVFTDFSKIDAHLDMLAYVGMALAGIVLVFGCANMVMMFVLWTLYHSIVNIGQRW